jgi:GAF domain-containing protein
LDLRANRLEPRSCYGLSDGFVEKVAGLFDPAVIEQVMSGECVQIHEAAKDDRVLRPKLMAEEGASSVLMVPLTSRGKGVGIVSLYTHHPYRFSTEELQLMTAIGDQCSLAIDNAKMYGALKNRYESLVDDFQLWFEHTQARPHRGVTENTG